MTTKKFFKTISILLFSTICISCATPVTTPLPISKEEYQREKNEQEHIAKTYKPKKINPAKFKSDAEYIYRLETAIFRLNKAAKIIYNNPKIQYKIALSEEPIVNAWADGTKITFTKHMMEFLDTDEELATIMAHEYSHNLMGHIDKKKTNILAGTVLDILAATQGIDTKGEIGQASGHAHSQGFENEADYIGIYLLYHAGYNIEKSPNLWRKMAVESPSGIKSSFFSSHPSHAERFLRMRKTIKEIYQQKADGNIPMPKLKS